MKKIIAGFLILFSLLVASCYGQKQVRITVAGGRSFCGFNVNNGFYVQNLSKSYITHEAVVGDDSGIPDVIEKIKSTLGFSIPIRVFIAKGEDNCSASIGNNGVRAIIADQLFLNKVNNISGTEWAAISIIAHEIGHHIAGMNRRPSVLESELDADYWSGYILKLLGASKEASVRCIMRFGTESNTTSHPNKYSRANTIKQGWDDAVTKSFDKGRCASCN